MTLILKQLKNLSEDAQSDMKTRWANLVRACVCVCVHVHGCAGLYITFLGKIHVLTCEMGMWKIVCDAVIEVLCMFLVDP